MKFSLKEMKGIVHGALNVVERDGVFRFVKCTENQTKSYFAQSEKIGKWSNCTVGVTLDFVTDSSRFSFEILNEDYLSLEIYVNGLLHSFFKNGEKRKIEVDLLGENRVTVYLPAHLISAELTNLEIDDGAKVQPVSFDRTFLFLGDSITQGWNSGFDSMSFANILSRVFNAEKYIQGVGGAYYDEDTLEYLGFNPTVVFVAYGTNDFHKFSLKETVCRADKYYKKVKAIYSNSKIIVISPIWRKFEEQEATLKFKKHCEGIKKTAQENGLEVIDGFSVFPHDTSFFADGYLHPNALGFYVYAENLIKIINEII